MVVRVHLTEILAFLNLPRQLLDFKPNLFDGRQKLCLH
jgi:hypothetical protein